LFKGFGGGGGGHAGWFFSVFVDILWCAFLYGFGLTVGLLIGLNASGVLFCGQ
jgi:hypothetical protein